MQKYKTYGLIFDFDINDYKFYKDIEANLKLIYDELINKLYMLKDTNTDTFISYATKLADGYLLCRVMKNKIEFGLLKNGKITDHGKSSDFIGTSIKDFTKLAYRMNNFISYYLTHNKNLTPNNLLEKWKEYDKVKGIQQLLQKQKAKSK